MQLGRQKSSCTYAEQHKGNAGPYHPEAPDVNALQGKDSLVRLSRLPKPLQRSPAECAT